MHTAELLVELGTEEIPASILEGSARQLARNLAEGLRAERLPAEVSAIWYTPRRLVAALKDLPDRQEDLVETVMGPPRRVAFDAEGNPTRAALAFAEKTGTPLSRIKTIGTAKGEYLAAVRRHKGMRTSQVLQRVVPAAIANIQFPKAMYWSADQFRFARPLRWIVAIYAGRVIRFSLADVTSSRYTSGHRFRGKRRIPVKDPASLRDALRENGVLVDPAERESRVRASLERAAEAAGGRMLPDDVLLQTVVNLNELPSVVCGSFERRFLSLPDEILITVMKEHQKYFSVVDPSGTLLPAFLAVINLEDDPSGKIRSGHERVLRARFADAEFFWNADRATRLGDREQALRGVVFQQKLGSYYDKTQRVLALLPKIAHATGCGDRIADLEAAARLLKCDLTTEMVKEFTDLQGVVGGLYARAEGYPEAVWRPVYEQYMPKSSSSPSPSTRPAAVLSLTDRLDTVCGCFSAGLIPSGSKDPFAVRRQGNGILKILIDHQIHASLSRFIDWSLAAFPAADAGVGAELNKFLEGRLRFLLDEMKYSYDTVNAALAAGLDDPVDAVARVRALQEMRREPEFLALSTSFKRVMNIIGDAAGQRMEPDAELLQEGAEKALWSRCLEIRPLVEDAGRQHRYPEALRLMASLRGDVDRFFTDVLVMAEDPALRANRLALLAQLARLFLSVADISQIAVEGSA